jgi:protein disulfide-isomerase A1
LAPEYEIAATKLKDSVSLAKVDCTVEEALCGRFSIQGFPTLKIFRGAGSISEYNGGRKADDIISTMKKQSLPAVSYLESGKVKEFSASDRVVVIGVFGSKDSAEEKTFTALANKLRDKYVFGVTTDKSTLSEHKVADPGVILFKKFDEKVNVFGGSITEKDLNKFVLDNAIPNMDEIGPDNFATYSEKGLPLLYLFVSTDEERKTAGAEVEPLAKDYKGKVSFVYLDASKFGGHAESVNLKEQWPALALADMKKNSKFPFDQSKKIEKAAVKAWLDGILAGTVEPSYKSEPIPESNDAPVKVVVNKNYASIVKDTSKDVFIEYYAPWCGHCKKLAPIWEEFAESIGTDNIVIAKMDGTANDLPSDSPFQIQGFPTLKLFQAKTGKIINYEGDRSLASLISFVKANAHFGSEVTASESDAKDDGDSSGNFYLLLTLDDDEAEHAEL